MNPAPIHMRMTGRILFITQVQIFTADNNPFKAPIRIPFSGRVIEFGGQHSKHGKRLPPWIESTFQNLQSVTFNRDVPGRRIGADPDRLQIGIAIRQAQGDISLGTGCDCKPHWSSCQAPRWGLDLKNAGWIVGTLITYRPQVRPIIAQSRSLQPHHSPAG